MSTVRKSLALSFANKTIAVASSFVSVMILARLLTPGQIGVFAIAASFLSLVGSLRDFGVGGYIVQERDLTEQRMRSACGVSFAISWGMGIAVVLAAPLVAYAYGQSDLADLIRIMALNFFIIPFNVPGLAILRREMRFDLVLRITLIASLAQPITSVCLALLGYGYYSLVWASVANVVVMTLALRMVRPGSFVAPSFRGWRRMLKFGGQWSLIGMITQSDLALTDLMLGRIVGFEGVALFSRAMGVINLFRSSAMAAINSVAFPAFAKQLRENQDLRMNYLLALSYLTAVSFPFFAFTGVMAYPVIRVLFGDQWDPAAPVLRILACGGLIYSVWHMGRELLLSAGQVNARLWETVIIQAAQVSLIAIGGWWDGIGGAALGFTVAAAIGLIVNSYFLRKFVGIEVVLLLTAALRSLWPMLGALVAPVGVTAWAGLEPAEPGLWLFVGASGSAAGWLAALFVSRHPLADDIESAVTKLAVRLSQRRAI